MILLTLLNISLLGNITTTLNLTTNLAPAPKVDIVETSEFNFSSRYLSQSQDVGNSINFDNIPNLDLKPAKPKVASITKIINQEIKPSANGGLLSIDKIGIKNLKLAKSSISTIDDMNKKMLYSPVIESSISPDLCSDSGNSYISGHSEPASNKDSNYPGVNVFSDLNSLVTGDIIKVKNSSGLSCSYRVTGWDKATTDSNNKVSSQVFADAYYPITDKPTLTIQTCQKGSATVRLLLRAEKI